MKIQDAIDEFKRRLPDWWWSVGECSISADASCGPDRNCKDAHLLVFDEFDNGFHHNEPMPASCADSLIKVMNEALQKKEEVEGKD